MTGGRRALTLRGMVDRLLSRWLPGIIGLEARFETRFEEARPAFSSSRKGEVNEG
jgi:hypothetical protein